MGRFLFVWSTVTFALCAKAAGSPPRTSYNPFKRIAVETVPEHEPISTPIRSSVESIPLRSTRDEGDVRLPLRDAVEKPPITILDQESLYKFLEDDDDTTSDEDVLSYKDYYGAASYLNNNDKNNEKFQHGNMNLQEMQQTHQPAGRRMVVCYMESWAAYRAPPLAFTAALVPRTCTHLHYAFASIHPHTYAVLPGNEDYDVVRGGYRIATSLKSRIPGLKVLVSVGGEGTERLFSEMVLEPSRRNQFIKSAIDFLKEHDFDGLDLHWVYPGERDEGEKELLTTLLYELREKFSSYGFLLTTVLPPFRYQIEDGYDLLGVSDAIDYATLQAWDMTDGKRDELPSRAAHHSALHRDPTANARDQRYNNIEFMVKYILRHGMAAEKLVLGVPLFGRSYSLANPASSAPGALIEGWGTEGFYTLNKGLLAYFEICMAEREGKGTNNVDDAGNSYAVFDDQWVSYDTPATVAEKMKLVTSMDLGGAAAWAIDMDDFRGLCGTPFPIISTISRSLNGQSTQADQSTLKIGSCESRTPYLSSDAESCAHFHFCTGGINYRIECEDHRLYDPSTGFCGHQDVTKCIPGQSLRISVEEAARFLSQAYESDFEWSSHPTKETTLGSGSEPLVYSSETEFKKNKDNNKRVICYMTSWAFYRRGDGKFVPEHIDTRLCTHVVYAYATLSPDELIAKEFDPWADVTNNLYERVTSLKDVKVLLGLGGWTDSAGDKYSRLVSSPSARANFIKKMLSLLHFYNFKGLHLDWNYPVCWQSNCKKGAISDKANFAKLVQELSQALHEADMELGLAISGYKEVIESGYDLPALSKAADFLSAMTYDYHGGWERSTAHHTPLVPPPNDPLAYYSVEYAIRALIQGGADPKKLLLGLSFYGQSYRLAEGDGPKGPGSPAGGPGEPGEFTKQPGMLAYYEICYRVKNLRWTTGRQDKAGPYAYFDNQWVGYDDPKSITDKVEWALRQGLGGVTAWAIDLDDFNNRCCGEPSPLLRAAGRALGRVVPPPPATACERPPEPITPAPPTTPAPAESDGSISGDHHHHTTTTWPSWSTATTSTTQNWQPATTSKTTTTTTTTTKRPIVTPAMDSDLDQISCVPGEYSAADSCGSYLQCSAGKWKKLRCAPGLHWSVAAKRCDWPSFAKCTLTTSTETSTTKTSTLAPMTSRPPLTSTSRRTTTTTTTTTTPTPTTTRTTTTRTTTTRPTTTRTTTTRPTTTKSTTTPPTTTKPTQSDSDGFSEGGSCSGTEYHSVAGDCNAYLHCDGHAWRRRQCAPGLHWSASANHCDWPKFAKCEANTKEPTTTSTSTPIRPQKPAYTTMSTTNLAKSPREGEPCSGADSHTSANTCDTYLLCVGGRWRKQLCPPGLHWDQRTRRCDWIEFAMCQGVTTTSTTTTTTTTPPTTTSTTTSTTSTTTRRPPKRPYTTKAPTTPNNDDMPNKGCRTGTYHTHPRCEKFYICVNGVLVAQSCAPGLVWRPDRSQCDFPTATACNDRRGTTIPETKPTSMQLVEETSTYCNNGEYAVLPGDCKRYQHCIFGKFQEFACSAGLHWNQEKQICDWPANAKCKKRRPATAQPSRPVLGDPVLGPPPRPHEETQRPTLTTSKPSITVPTSVTSSSKPALLNSRYKMVCYYSNWSWYRPGIGKYGPEDIDPSLCTHIVYGFAVLGRDGLINAHDSWADYDNQLYERVVAYKRNGIKVSLAIGGWNDSADDKYSKLVNNPSARARFVSHAVQFLQKFGFDGLDVDWEYPKCWQVDCSKGPDSDKDGFSGLIRELSAELKPRGLLLSSAVSPNKHVIDEGYDVRELSKYLDWIAIMTYDYHGQWDKKTGHVAPLYYHPEDDNTYFNANYTIHYWLKKGAPPSKLVMGMPMYGQSFTLGTNHETSNELLSRKDETGLNSPALSGGEAGEYTRAKGFLAYYEICDRIKNHGWTVVKDPYQRMGPYAYKGDQWVSFDDKEIIKKKVNFIKSLNLAGGMIWALDLDDFRDRCGEGKHPLLTTIVSGLLDPNIDLDLEPINQEQSTVANPNKQPIMGSSNALDDDFDIQVRPQKKPTTSRPMQTMSSTAVASQTTKKPENSPAAHAEPYKIVCYYTNWAWYRPGPGKYTTNDIDPSLCTHIVYSYAVLDTSRLVIKPQDTWLDIENKFYEKVVALKSKGVKVLLGLGGWNDSGGNKYSRLVNNASSRRKFVVHVVDFLEEYGFDGLNLDWEFPKCWQANCEKGPSTDRKGFTALVKELRSAFTSRGLLLAGIVSANKRVIDVAYDVRTLSDNLDWMSLMSYDYHGQWDKKTGHLAPMYTLEDDDSTLNVNFSVNYWINKGADRKKLVLGVPTYGQSFSLTENGDTGLGAEAYAGGEAGDETRARGFLAFYEICERIRVNGWKVFRDPGGRMGPYATMEDQWVSFDDDFMVRHKAEYVRAMGLGGAMVWSLDLDDFSGRYCGCGKSPLLASINHVLRGNNAPQPCSLEEIQGPIVSSSVSSTEKPTTLEPEKPGSFDITQEPQQIDIEEEHSGSSLDGKPCSGVAFKEDDTDCSKYYLCLNGFYAPLTCPAPLHWNKNHCDWPAKSKCKNKGYFKLAPEEDEDGNNFEDKPIIACYFTNWAFYRLGSGSFGPEQIEPSLCSHIIYAFAHLDEDTSELIPGIPELDVENDFFGKVTDYRLKGVKVIICAGGLEDSESNKWNEMAASDEKRNRFIDSAIKFVHRWKFDGLQLAWQYPVCNQAPCNHKRRSEKNNFSVLLYELANALRAQNMELSVMVSANPEIAAVAYDPSILAATADWIAISANDFYATIADKTSYIMPLTNDINSFNSSLIYWSSVVPARQLVVGIPAYGRSYTLRSTFTGPGAPIYGPGEPGPFTNIPGFLAYYEICSEMRSPEWQETNTEQGTFAVYESQWWSYLRPAEVWGAGASARAAGVRGGALWALDLDDWRAGCGCASYPLLNALRYALLDATSPVSACQ